MIERMIPVPESLIERIVDGVGPTRTRAFDELLALLSQPTPTAGPKCICTPAIAGISDGPNVGCPIHGEHSESPRIEDMAAGTMFTEEVRWTVTGTLSTGSTVAHSVSGEMRFADRFDPSTIRDVTPPKDVTV